MYSLGRQLKTYYSQLTRELKRHLLPKRDRVDEVHTKWKCECHRSILKTNLERGTDARANNSQASPNYNGNEAIETHPNTNSDRLRDAEYN